MRFEPGDLLLFYGRDLSSRVIEWATRGPSHVGIVCPHLRPPDLSCAGGSGETGTGGEERRETLAPRPGDTLLLFESTTLCDLPCLHRSQSCRTCYEDGLRRKWREELSLFQNVAAPVPVKIYSVRELRAMAPWPRAADAKRCFAILAAGTREVN